MDPAAFRETASGHLVTSEGGHAAFMPAPLPPALTFSGGLPERLSAADSALGELSGLAGGRRDPQIIVAPFLRQEAVLSSRIEGMPATLVDLLFDEVAAAPDLELRENLREVRNYAAALQYGIERLADVPLGAGLVLGRLSHPLLHPSAYIEAHRDEYYGLLQAVRTDGAWSPGCCSSWTPSGRRRSAPSRRRARSWPCASSTAGRSQATRADGGAA